MHELIVILNLIILESLLSVDNSTALAAMVKHLPEKQQGRALKYGLGGAYLFRGLCLVLASYLMGVLWLKIAGGLYLIWLLIKYFKDKKEEESGQKVIKKGFWATVISLEILDLSLSIDNIFAAVALTDNIYLIMAGVFIGILAMRFVAGKFVKLINRYPSLETSAFIVIGILGIKLVISGTVDYIPSAHTIKAALESHTFDLLFSGSMMAIFFVPLLFKERRAVAEVILTAGVVDSVVDAVADSNFD